MKTMLKGSILCISDTIDVLLKKIREYGCARLKLNNCVEMKEKRTLLISYGEIFLCMLLFFYRIPDEVSLFESLLSATLYRLRFRLNSFLMR